VTNDGAAVVELVWRQNPDAAIESGNIPTSYWDDPTREAQKGLIDSAQSIAAARQNVEKQYEQFAINYHANSVIYCANQPPISRLNHMTGPIAQLSWAADSWPVHLDGAASAYIDRLATLPAYCARLVDAIHEDAANLRLCSAVVLQAFAVQAEEFLRVENSDNGTLLTPLRQMQQYGVKFSWPDSDLTTNVLSSVDRLRKLSTELANTASSRSPLAASRDGAEHYFRAIHYGTSLEISPAEVERIGQTILDRGDHRFRQLARELDVVQVFPSTTKLLEQFTIYLDAVRGRLGRLFRRTPLMDCLACPMPDANATVGPPAFYGLSSHKQNRPGRLYVNLKQVSKTRVWEILPLVMHEGLPGHHLQLALLDETPGIPDFLRLLSVNAFTEGWAVYAETLGPAMDLDIEPIDEFGLLSHQRWRAARLLTDVGLHVRGWTVAQATEFLSGITLQHKESARREVIRYLAWPGQALGYSLGSEAISDWIAEQRKRGTSLRDAHDKLLSIGSIPLAALKLDL
jgi:uncharacterized protein (DUF885 family)